MRVWTTGIVACVAMALLVAIIVGAFDRPDSTPSSTAGSAGGPHFAENSASGSGSGPRFASRKSGRSTWIPASDRVLAHEAIPCTGLKDPINFEIFSAGPVAAGLPLNSVVRRCDAGAPADEAPANYVAYTYGHCEIAEGATGCAPPLQVHTWPACQRSLAEYSFEGKPLPYKELPKRGGAKVVEIDFFIDNRIEVYTKSSTIVIFASDPALARKAVDLLRSQEEGKPPARSADALGEQPLAQFVPPSAGAMKGELSCQS
jgi:hypothetical protein